MQGGLQKSKPLPNLKKIVLNIVLKSANIIRHFRQIKEMIKHYKSVGIKYSPRYLLFDVNNYAWPTK